MDRKRCQDKLLDIVSRLSEFRAWDGRVAAMSRNLPITP